MLPDNALSVSPSSLATAADIPIELYDLLLYFLQPPAAGNISQGSQEQRNKVIAKKRELGQLGLVCRPWAHMCQKKMFRTVTLQSHKDFRELLALASHPWSRISQYTERLQLVANNNSTPWIHDVCLKVPARSTSTAQAPCLFPACEGHILDVCGPAALEVLRQGLHAALPRQPIPAFSRNIVFLHINAVELIDITGLARLGKELPSLERLSFQDITWTVAPATESETIAPLVRRLRKPSYTPVKTAHVAQSSEGWAGLLLLCLWENAHPLRVEDISAVAGLARTLTASAEQGCNPVTVSVRDSWGYGSCISHESLLGVDLIDSAGLAVRADWERHLAPFLWIPTIEDPTTNSKYWRVGAVALQFSPDRGKSMLPLKDMLEYNWEEFDERAASLTALRQVIIGVRDRDELSLFIKIIEPKMPLLRGSRRLKYALELYTSDGSFPVGWMAVTSESADEGLCSVCDER